MLPMRLEQQQRCALRLRRGHSGLRRGPVVRMAARSHRIDLSDLFAEEHSFSGNQSARASFLNGS